MNENSTMTMNKAYTTLEKKEVDAESRTIVAWGSRPVQDRDKEIIDSSAWDLKNFQKNPVLMLSHNYSLPPIGRVVWIKATKEGLRFKAEFAKTQMGEEIWSLYRDGFMQSFSVGFLAKKYEEPDDHSKDTPRRIYKDVELLEISCVSIPSCPDALLEAYNNGTIKTKEFRSFIEDQLKLITVVPDEKEFEDGHEEKTEAKEQEEEGTADGSDREEQKEIEYEIEIVTKPETTENYHHIPVSSGHDDHEIRTIVISAKKGIKALYCVPCKAIKTYLFDVDKFTMEEARQWIEDHKKSADEENYCECEEPEFENDECKGCGGRRKPRKPKKEVEEIEDVGFGEVMGEEPNPVKLDSLEVEVTINKEHLDNMLTIIDALNQKVLSLEARLMDIQSLRLGDDGCGSHSPSISSSDVEEKAGRTLSRKTRDAIQRAIDALNDLITLADKPKEDDDDDEDEDEDEEKSLSLQDLMVEKEEKPNFDEKEVSAVVKEVLNDVFSKYSIDAKEILDEALKRQKGKMF